MAFNESSTIIADLGFLRVADCVWIKIINKILSRIAIKVLSFFIPLLLCIKKLESIFQNLWLEKKELYSFTADKITAVIELL